MCRMCDSPPVTHTPTAGSDGDAGRRHPHVPVQNSAHVVRRHGSCVGDSVGRRVGWNDGTGVGRRVGSMVGMRVGARVGARDVPVVVELVCVRVVAVDVVVVPIRCIVR